MRIRSILIILALTYMVYRLLPSSKKGAMRERVAGLGQALVLSVALFWVWMLVTLAWNTWRG